MIQLEGVAKESPGRGAAVEGLTFRIPKGAEGKEHRPWPAVVLSRGRGSCTLYLYLSELSAAEGSRVRVGRRPGSVGGEGTVEGPHLQFQVRMRPADREWPPPADPLESPAPKSETRGRR